MKYGTISQPDIIDTTCELVHDKFIDDYTKLLLHLDNGVVDSAKNKTVTNNGVTFSTTSQFGGYSGLFTRASSQYLSVADSEDWYFGNADFTIDFWVRFNSLPGQMMLVNQWVDASNYWAVDWNNDNTLRLYNYSGAVFTVYVTCPFAPSTGQWYHLAVVKTQSTVKMFVDGVSKTVTLQGGSFGGSMSNFAAALEIGRYGAGSLYLDGYIDEFRISKGIARWTADFSTALPSQSYNCPLDTQTKLLIHGGGPNNGITFYDNSTTARTLTTVGNTKYDSTITPALRVSSIKFDGNADYIWAADSADWDYGSGDWTWECYLMLNSIRSGTNWVGGQYVVATSDGCEWYIDGANNRLYADAFASGGSTIFQSYAEYTFSTGVWYHIATVRSGNTLYFFINGVSQAVVTPTASISGKTLPNVGANYDIGGFSGAGAAHKNSIDGWIDEYRISKGIARYTSNFTPPAAPYDSPLMHYVIDGLNGDVDKEYRLISLLRSTGADDYMSMQFNGDTANNYGWQTIYGANTTAAANRNTSINFVFINQGNAADDLGLTEHTIYAKSGKVRTVLSKVAYSIAGTTVGAVQSRDSSWNNATDNLTAITFTTAIAAINNGIGVGSRLILLKKRELTTGTKTGEIDPQGSTYGHWQLIYDNTLTVAKTNLMLTSQMDSYTKLLIHADGADATTAFYDFSNSAHVVTRSGTVDVDTAQSKFGGASALFNAGVSDRIDVADSTDWNFGSGDFTIDMWVRFNSVATRVNLMEQFLNGSSYWVFYYDVGSGPGTRILGIASVNGSNSGTFQAEGLTITTGVWYHIALVRSGSNCYMFLDGVSKTVTTYTAWGTLPDVAMPLEIGQSSINTGNALNGWMDEIRISKGIARWTANFTPPTRAYNELDGDRDVLYRMLVRGVSAGTTVVYKLRHNQDSGSNYGYQYLRGTSTAVSASRSTGTETYGLYNGSSSGELYMIDDLMYVKSGFVRPFLLIGADGITGTTIGTQALIADVWNNTTDKITRIQAGIQTNILGIGTHIELWRLNL